MAKIFCREDMPKKNGFQILINLTDFDLPLNYDLCVSLQIHQLLND